MATAQAPNPRASLLSGLRTGGVRSVSGPMANLPYTAAPGGNFSVPRLASYHPSFPEEDEDEIGDMPSKNHYSNAGTDRPMTAAVDGARFSQQQTRMNANSPPFVPSFSNTLQTPSPQAQVQAMQEMQMLQMEVMRLQVSHFTQLARCNIDALSQKVCPSSNNIRRLCKRSTLPSSCVSKCHNPRRAGTSAMSPPLPVLFNNSFDLRSATLSAQNRRANQTEILKAQLGVGGDSQVPMSAAAWRQIR